MNSQRVRTRFAPSPTGLMHIGGLRTALYSWALAKRYGGDFLLRLEDTDQTRKVPEAVRSLLEMFRWVGLEVDEGPSGAELETLEPGLGSDFSFAGEHGPYIQSLRLDRYKEVAEELIARGHAYRCDITEQELGAEREILPKGASSKLVGRNRDKNLPADKPHSVRFRMPDEAMVELEDGIRGRIQWQSIPLQDPVLLKSDGFATYHLAAMVDDHDMKISHVFRGEEWLSSAPLHVLIYQAMDWVMPVFCHLPVILGEDGKKLSKRHGSTTWSLFRDEGYLPEALLNFVALIGWSPKGDREIFDRNFIAENFSLEGVQSASGIFDFEKLRWMNAQYIKEMSDRDFIEAARPFLAQAAVDAERLMPVAALLKERVRVLSDLKGEVGFFTEQGVEFQAGLLPDKVRTAELPSILTAVADGFEGLEVFNAASIETFLQSFLTEKGLGAGQVFLPIRIATTGTKQSPALAPTLEALGKELVCTRLRTASGLL